MKLIKSRFVRALNVLAILLSLVVAGFVSAAPAQAAVRSCTSSTAVSQRPVLYYGDTGSCVKEGQRLLNLRGGYGLVRDGSFGPATLRAVKHYQSAHGISPTGNIGPNTWASLVSGKSAPKSGVKATRSNCWTTSSKVRLSFDDTASNAALDSILATLKKKNVKATFFFNTSTTSNAKFAKIRKAGHNVANHTYGHPDLTTLSTKAIKSEVTRGRSDYTNSKLVRPPYGATNPTVTKAINDLGYKECTWTVDTMDWSTSASPSAATIVSRVKYGDKWSPRVYAGGMVLMHGTGKYTPAALPGVINAVRDLGYTLPKLR